MIVLKIGQRALIDLILFFSSSMAFIVIQMIVLLMCSCYDFYSNLFTGTCMMANKWILTGENQLQQTMAHNNTLIMTL